MTTPTRSLRGWTALAACCALFVPMVSHADTALQKAGRGLAAITTPFLEIPGNIIVTTEREGAAAGWTEGLAKENGMFIVRPAIGFYELVTSPIPAPANYEPILQPEYPWSYFGSGYDSGVARR
jgi:putative exosortase-associated protein (TIGR04073 family)